MKLSELFRTPFKLKGGSTLNLKGFSKAVVDKEVGGGENNKNAAINNLLSLFNYHPIYPHPTKVLNKYDSIIDINEVDDDNYKFLYKKSEFENLETGTLICTHIIYTSNTELDILFETKGTTYCEIVFTTEIDGEEYVALGEGSF